MSAHKQLAIVCQQVWGVSKELQSRFFAIDELVAENLRRVQVRPSDE